MTEGTVRHCAGCGHRFAGRTRAAVLLRHVRVRAQ